MLISIVFLPFSAFLTLLSQSHFTRYLSYSSSSAIPVMVNHVCTSELTADLGRSFSKRKNYGGNFHSWSSHLTSSQHSSCLTLRGLSWQRWVCLVMSDMLLPKASGCFWRRALLDPEFSASQISTRTAHCQHLNSQWVGFIISLIPVSHINIPQPLQDPAFVLCHIALHSILPLSQNVKQV